MTRERKHDDEKDHSAGLIHATDTGHGDTLPRLNYVEQAIAELDAILQNDRKCFAEDSDADEFLGRVQSARTALTSRNGPVCVGCGAPADSRLTDTAAFCEACYRRDHYLAKLAEVEAQLAAVLEYAKLEQAVEDLDCPHDADGQCDCGHRQDAMFRRARELRKRILAGTLAATCDPIQAASPSVEAGATLPPCVNGECLYSCSDDECKKAVEKGIPWPPVEAGEPSTTE